MNTTKTFLIAGFILMVCFNQSMALDMIKKESSSTILLPQGTNEGEVMKLAINQGEKMGYDLKREEGKIVLSKTFVPGILVHEDQFYRIVLAIVSDREGRKIMTLETEVMGRDLRSSLHGGKPNLYSDVTQIETIVKQYLASK